MWKARLPPSLRLIILLISTRPLSTLMQVSHCLDSEMITFGRAGTLGAASFLTEGKSLKLKRNVFRELQTTNNTDKLQKLKDFFPFPDLNLTYVCAEKYTNILHIVLLFHHVHSSCYFFFEAFHTHIFRLLAC